MVSMSLVYIHQNLFKMFDPTKHTNAFHCFTQAQLL